MHACMHRRSEKEPHAPHPQPPFSSRSRAGYFQETAVKRRGERAKTAFRTKTHQLPFGGFWPRFRSKSD